MTLNREIARELNESAKALKAMSEVSSYLSHECDESAIVDEGLVGLSYVTRAMSCQFEKIAQKAATEVSQNAKPGKSREVDVTWRGITKRYSVHASSENDAHLEASVQFVTEHPDSVRDVFFETGNPIETSVLVPDAAQDSK